MAVEFADARPDGFDDAGTTWEIVQDEVPGWLKDWPSSEGRTAIVGMPVCHCILNLRRVHRYIEPGRGPQHRANRRSGVYVQGGATLQLVVTSISSGVHSPRTKQPVAGDRLNIFGVLHNAGGAWKMVGITISPVYLPRDNRWRVDITSGPEAIPDGLEVVEAAGVVDLAAVAQSGR